MHPQEQDTDREAAAADVLRSVDPAWGPGELADGDAAAWPAERVRLMTELRIARAGERRAREELAAATDAGGLATEVLAHIGDGVLLVDARGKVALWNRAAASITGVPAEAVVGRDPAEAIPGWANVAAQVPVTVLPHSGSMHSLTVPMSGELWVSISGVEFPGGTVYAFRDVSDVREIERMKSDFVATVSHELRTPLASVYGSAVTLQRGDVLDEQVRGELVGIIAAESERLGRIVNDILLASHIDSGRIHLRDDTFDLRQLVESVVASTRTRVSAGTSVEVAAAVAEAPLVLLGDRDRIRQVVVNLVENAIKYSPDGGDVRVVAERSQGGTMAHLAVIDDGIGIAPRDHRRIFEKFCRVDPRQRRGIGGTGLGLYICRELVDRMGGRIWLESAEGAGSTFHVELPLAGSYAP